MDMGENIWVLQLPIGPQTTVRSSEKDPKGPRNRFLLAKRPQVHTKDQKDSGQFLISSSKSYETVTQSLEAKANEARLFC